jgi:hypothetical protein
LYWHKRVSYYCYGAKLANEMKYLTENEETEIRTKNGLLKKNEKKK